MIDSFQVLVPSSVQVGETFTVIVRALDALGNVITDDNTTVVELTSADLDLLFDADEDGTFTLIDNQKTLVNGEASFLVLDNKADNFNLFADNSPDGPITIQGDLNVLYGFNSLPIVYLESTPANTDTLSHPRFFSPRDTVVLTPVEEVTPDGSPDSNAFELRDELTVTLIP